MPDNRQKYHITIGYTTTHSVQCITYLDRKAFRVALAGERDEFGLVHIDCRSTDDEHIDLDVSPDGIQLILHQKWNPPARADGRIAVPSRLVQ